MKNIIFEIPKEKDIKLNNKEINKLILKEKSELELKNTNIDINKNKKFNKFSKKEILYSCIICCVKILYIYLFSRREEKRKLIKEEQFLIKIIIVTKKK